MSEQQTGQRGGVPEGLRAAVERTIAATASSAASTRERAEALVGDAAPLAGAQVRDRAAELLDEVARLGHEAGQRIAARSRGARGAVGRRGEDAGEVSETLAAARDAVTAAGSAVGTSIQEAVNASIQEVLRPRVREAVRDLEPVEAPALAELAARLDRIERRLERLEAAAGAAEKDEPKPEVEG